MFFVFWYAFLFLVTIRRNLSVQVVRGHCNQFVHISYARWDFLRVLRDFRFIKIALNEAITNRDSNATNTIVFADTLRSKYSDLVENSA